MNNIIWGCIVAVLVLGIVIYAMKKNEVFRIGVFAVICIALPIGASWCGIQLNTYYNAEGGIIGHLTGVYNPNEIEVVDELNYTVKNIELKQVTDSSDVYSAKVIVNDVFEYDSKQNYTITVNESPCFSVTPIDDGVIATYSYNFYNEKYEFLMNDDLTISIAFYDTYTYFIFTTEGGEEAVKNWNSYFNTHEFVINFEKSHYEKDYNFDEVEGVTPEASAVNYYVNDELYLTKVVQPATNSDLSLIVENDKYYLFQGWSEDGETVVDVSSYDTTSNVNLYAVFEKVAGVYDADWNLLNTWESLVRTDDITISETTWVGLSDNCSNWDILVVAEGITTIGDGVDSINPSFSGELILPDTLTTINEMAFFSTGITSLTIPRNVVSIGSQAFYWTKNLLSVWIPESVIEVGVNSEGRGPFYKASGFSTLVIYCERSEAYEDWSENWYYREESDNSMGHTMKYGYTYEQYLAETNQI